MSARTTQCFMAALLWLHHCNFGFVDDDLETMILGAVLASGTASHDLEVHVRCDEAELRE